MRTPWLAFSLMKSFLPWRSRGALALTNALRVSCAYAEYVLRTFNIRCIRANYAARRLVMRYAYASHTLKTYRRALAYDKVCVRKSYLQVTLMNLCLTYSYRTPNL